MDLYVKQTRIPGLPGSRLFSHPKLLSQSLSGFRLFILERPGLGLSSKVENLNFLKWTKDIHEFLKSKVADRKVNLLGYSAGGPWALASCLLYFFYFFTNEIRRLHTLYQNIFIKLL